MSAGALAGSASEIANGVLQKVLAADPGLSHAQKSAITEWVAAAVGAASGGETGAAAGLDNVEYNYLTHEEALKKAEAERKLAACAARPGSCSADEIRRLTDTIAALDKRDAETNRAALTACATGSPLSCLGYLSRLEAIRQGFAANALSPGDPDFKGVAAEFYVDSALVSVLHSLVAYRDSRDLAAMMASFDLGAVAGVGAAVAVYGALDSTEAASALVATCGKVAARYGAHFNLVLQDLQASMPELGGSGVGLGGLAAAEKDAVEGALARGGEEAGATIGDAGPSGGLPDGVSFGRNANQDFHVWRHVEDELGMSRQRVQDAIVADLPPVAYLADDLNVRFVTVDGVRLQYNAFKLSDGTVNIGRIHEAN